MNNVTLFFQLFIGATVGLFSDFNILIRQVDVQRPSRCIISRLQKLEASFRYPFSDNEEFIIKHGKNGDYFSFFKSLGKPHYYTAISKKNKTVKKTVSGKEVIVHHKADEIAAAMCCVLRTVKDKRENSIQAWYICDLKVNPSYQGEHLPLKMMQSIAFSCFIKCPRGFAICMNPATGDPKAASIFKKHGPISSIKTETLNLYSLSLQQAQEHRDYLQRCLIHNGYMKKNMNLGFVTTSGAKDYEIINKSAKQGRSWNLFHIKPTSVHGNEQEGATYMVCAIEGTGLDNDFRKVLGLPSSTAQILSYGMEDVDFNFLASDQI